MAKSRIKRLERATRQQRNARELAELFLHNMATVKALAAGEEPPPPHPRSSDSRFAGTFFEGHTTIKGREPGTPVPDLSE